MDPALAAALGAALQHDRKGSLVGAALVAQGFFESFARAGIAYDQ